MKSVCSKIACREEDGSKPKMILPHMFKPSKRKNVKRKLAVDVSETSIDSKEDSTDDVPDYISNSEDDKELESEVDVVAKEVKIGDYVTVTRGPFRVYYALVTGNSYGGEVEIQYFEKYSKWWIIKDNELDSMEPCDLEVLTKKVSIDNKSHYWFS